MPTPKIDKVQMILDNARKKIEGETYKPAKSSALSSMLWNQEVQNSKDLERILQIPRRRWMPEEAEFLAERMTPLLAKDGGTQILRPVQAVALHDLGSEKGLICTARVGAGKTLIILLAPYVVQALRPLIIIPANLREKTERDIKAYRKHWEIAEFVRIESYETLSRKGQAKFFEDYRPDLVMCDEAHHLKNTRAAVTKRLKRYLRDIRPHTILGLLSGTMTNRSLREYWHLLRWTLPEENCPLPHSYEQLDMWAQALDEKVGSMNRVQPGALHQLYSDGERELSVVDPLRAARLAYQRRVADTPGIVITEDKFEGASLQIAALRVPPPEVILKAIARLHDDWETVDGHPIVDSTMKAKNEKEYDLGFFYRWKPKPPDEWLKARKAWCKSARKILNYNNRNLDTEEQVIEAIEDGLYPTHEENWEMWKEIRDTFTPNVEAVWIDDFAVDAAIEWSKKHAGIIWVYHKAFGKRLAEKSGLAYYANDGLDENGNFIEDHPPGTPLIASMKANLEGRNLQAWNYNLITHPPTSGKWWEQMLGRTHRDGQEADTVFVDMFYVSLEHLISFYRAKGDAQFVEDTSGQSQKLLYADILLPTLEEVGIEMDIAS